jgi:hypothetical protein
MTGLFPDAYPAYKQSTKMLIPYILVSVHGCGVWGN